MTVWSFCPTQIQKKLSEVKIKNKGNYDDLIEYRKLWIDWIKNFSGCENKNQWAPSNGIHDALINQVAYRHNTVSAFYTFDTDYRFYNVILEPYKHHRVSSNDIYSIRPDSYIIVSQPNHEGKITDWFEPLKEHCRSNNSKIFLDCAFYGTTLDHLDTSDKVFDCVAFSLSKNFLLGGVRAGIVFGDNISPSLTVPVSKYYDYNYYNCQAVEIAKIILSNFEPTYITKHAKKHQLEYCVKKNLTPADIWMWAFDENSNKICITENIKYQIQSDLDHDLSTT